MVRPEIDALVIFLLQQKDKSTAATVHATSTTHTWSLKFQL